MFIALQGGGAKLGKFANYFSNSSLLWTVCPRTSCSCFSRVEDQKCYNIPRQECRPVQKQVPKQQCQVKRQGNRGLFHITPAQRILITHLSKVSYIVLTIYVNFLLTFQIYIFSITVYNTFN